METQPASHPHHVHTTWGPLSTHQTYLLTLHPEAQQAPATQCQLVAGTYPLAACLIPLCAQLPHMLSKLLTIVYLVHACSKVVHSLSAHARRSHIIPHFQACYVACLLPSGLHLCCLPPPSGLHQRGGCVTSFLPPSTLVVTASLQAAQWLSQQQGTQLVSGSVVYLWLLFPLHPWP